MTARSEDRLPPHAESFFRLTQFSGRSAAAGGPRPTGHFLPMKVIFRRFCSRAFQIREPNQQLIGRALGKCGIFYPWWEP